MFAIKACNLTRQKIYIKKDQDSSFGIYLKSRETSPHQFPQLLRQRTPPGRPRAVTAAPVCLDLLRLGGLAPSPAVHGALRRLPCTSRGGRDLPHQLLSGGYLYRNIFHYVPQVIEGVVNGDFSEFYEISLVMFSIVPQSKTIAFR